MNFGIVQSQALGLPKTAPKRRVLAISASKNSQSNVATGVNLGIALSVSNFVLAAAPSFAKGGELGILEGRTAALIHPATMGFLLVASLYAGYLGLKIRTAREIPDQIKELKTQLPPADAEGNVPSSEVGTQIAQLEATRKDIIKSGVKDSHVNWGNLLLALGVTIGVEGPVNTYIRTGKLFPGPHLYAGASIVVLWALAASLTPAMQKGNKTARDAHIALNSTNILLFLWQVPTGLEIVGKVFEFTKWP